MSRQVMRVPLDFDHPIGTVWPGYVCDQERPCPVCDGRGTSTARQRLSDLVSLILLSGHDAERGACHPYFTRAPLHRTRGVVPSRDMVDLTSGLAGRPLTRLGHDAVDLYAATTQIMAAAGLPGTWGRCSACEGHGEDPATRAAVEAWVRTDPPAGDGWQMWETVSEGSPISPVFPTPEALGRWLAVTNASAFGSQGASYEAWMRMILGPGWAPSAGIVDEKLLNGVELTGGSGDGSR